MLRLMNHMHMVIIIITVCLLILIRFLFSVVFVCFWLDFCCGFYLSMHAMSNDDIIAFVFFSLSSFTRSKTNRQYQ